MADPQPAVPVDLERARVQLQAKLAELTSELEELGLGLAVPTAPVQYGKRAGDHISEVADRLARARAAQELEKLSDQVRAALARLEGGGYGRCERCGETIPEGRLSALPWAVRCVNCAGRPDPARRP